MQNRRRLVAVVALLLTWHLLENTTPANAAGAEPSAAPSSETSAQPATANSVLQDDNLGHRLHLMQDQVSEVRRDQLNYQIEKTLLRDAYSSNLQTVNLVITVALALLTALGFIGVKSIGAIRDEFRRELDQLRELRTQSESRLAEIEREQVAARRNVQDLEQTNAKQEQRLKVLELQEKCSQWINAGNFVRALEYIAVGLTLAPDDPVLLNLRTVCLMRLYRFDEAIVATEDVLRVEPSNDGAATNLCELYLLTRNQQGYRACLEKYGSAIQKRPIEAKYFEAIVAFESGDLDQLRNIAVQLVGSLTPEQSKKTKWRFNEFHHFVEREKDCLAKSMLLRLVAVLDGNLAPTDFLKEFSNAEPTSGAAADVTSGSPTHALRPTASK